jgi:hypothetical protein
MEIDAQCGKEERRQKRPASVLRIKGGFFQESGNKIEKEFKT